MARLLDQFSPDLTTNQISQIALRASEQVREAFARANEAVAESRRLIKRADDMLFRWQLNDHH
jgi:hypothetical protein